MKKLGENINKESRPRDLKAFALKSLILLWNKSFTDINLIKRYT